MTGVPGPLLVTHSCLSMPSLPAYLCSPSPSSSWLPHLFFLGEQSLPVLLTLCGLESSQKPHLLSWLCDLSWLVPPLWALWALKYWNHSG